MFMRVGGGIFTKAADVGADLVGKVEQGIPEDDPRNAATIADNVGDNVGDCAGMAADLFESYAVTLVAALILGAAAFGQQGLVFPLIVPAIGVLTAIIGVYITRAQATEGGLTTINRSFYISAVISAVLCVVAAFAYLPEHVRRADQRRPTRTVVATWDANPQVIAIVAVIIGIVLAGVILWLTGYFTETEHKPVKDVGESSLTGAATVILVGHLGRLRVGRLLRAGHRRGRVRRVPARRRLGHGGAVRRGAGGHRPADHGRRHRRHGHLRPGLATTPRASPRCPATSRGPGSRDPHRARRGRQHHQGDHQGHRDRDGRAGGHRAVRLLPRRDQSTAIGTVDVSASLRRSTTRSFTPNTLVGVIIGASVVFMFSGLAINAVTRAAGRDRVRGAPPVPGAPRDHGRHRAARVRPRRRHLHARLAARAGHARPAGGPRADRGRLRPRRRPARRLPRPAPSPPAP